MPVTARLSKKFYAALGEEVANELVDWFNAVDATYRADLRELNELNFARFDAKLEQRMVQLEAKIDRRINQLDARIDRQITELDAKLDRQVARLDAKIDQRGAQVEARLIRWMFEVWAPTAQTSFGTAVAVVALLLRS